MDVPASSSAVGVRMAAGVSSDPQALRAMEQVCEQCAAGLGSGGGGGGVSPDLAFLFFSPHHLEAAKALAYVARRRLGVKCLIGASAETVVGGETELENSPGVSMLAATLPGVGVHPFRLDQLPGQSTGSDGERAGMAVATGMSRDKYRGTILLVDPFSVAMNVFLPMLSTLRPKGSGENGPAPIIGGMASGAPKAGGNALLLDENVLNAGAVGVTLSGGPIRVDPLVSQGCRPFGPTFVVTSARNQMIKTLSGKPALEALHGAIETLDERSKSLLQRGLFIGRVVNEYKDRFGRGDFLIRNVVGAEQETGMVAVADLVRIGQTVQFHLRDAATASEDLGLLLDREKLYDEPLGMLLFTCNSRGTRLFDSPNHDAAAIARAFAPDDPGEIKAKPGRLIRGEGSGGRALPGGAIPLAGLFAAGEIGPIGNEVFLHGHTASAAIFRGAAE